MGASSSGGSDGAGPSSGRPVTAAPRLSDGGDEFDDDTDVDEPCDTDEEKDQPQRLSTAPNNSKKNTKSDPIIDPDMMKEGVNSGKRKDSINIGGNLSKKTAWSDSTDDLFNNSFDAGSRASLISSIQPRADKTEVSSAQGRAGLVINIESERDCQIPTCSALVFDEDVAHTEDKSANVFSSKNVRFADDSQDVGNIVRDEETVSTVARILKRNVRERLEKGYSLPKRSLIDDFDLMDFRYSAPKVKSVPPLLSDDNAASVTHTMCDLQHTSSDDCVNNVYAQPSQGDVTMPDDSGHDYSAATQEDSQELAAVMSNSCDKSKLFSISHTFNYKSSAANIAGDYRVNSALISDKTISVVEKSNRSENQATSFDGEAIVGVNKDLNSTSVNISTTLNSIGINSPNCMRVTFDKDEPISTYVPGSILEEVFLQN